MDHAKEASLALLNAPILFNKPRTAIPGLYQAALNIPNLRRMARAIS